MHVFKVRFYRDKAARVQEGVSAAGKHPRWADRPEADILRAALLIGIVALAKDPRAYDRVIEGLAREGGEPPAYTKRAPGRPRRRTA